MRAKDAARLSAVRLLLAAMKQKEVDERIELADADVLARHREDAQAAPRLDRAVREGGAPGPGRRGEIRDRRALGLPAAAAGRCRSRRRRSPPPWRRPAPSGVKDMGKVMALLKPQARRPRRHGQGLRPRQGQARRISQRLPGARRGDGRGTVFGAAAPMPQARARGLHCKPGLPPRTAVIPESFKQDLLNRIDIVEVVDRYVQLKKGGRQLLGAVPVPQREDAVFHGEPGEAVLPLLRLRDARQRHRLSHGLRRHGLRRRDQGACGVRRHAGARLGSRARRRRRSRKSTRAALRHCSKGDGVLPRTSSRKRRRPSSTSRAAASPERSRHASASAMRRTTGRR